MEPSARNAQQDAEEQVRKLQMYEKACQAFVDYEAPEACSPTTRRKAKSASSEELESAVCQYQYTDAVSVRSRRFVQGFGVQKCAQHIQYHLLSHTVDLDIRNCCITLTLQLLEKLEPSPPLPNDVLESLKEWVTSRERVCQDILKLPVAEGKQVVNAILNGGTLPEKLKDCTWTRRLQRASIYFRWLACSLLQDDYKELLRKGEKPFPSATMFYYMWTAVEDFVLEHWCRFLLRLKPTHLSLHFDGVRVNTNTHDDVSALQKECEEHIKTNTGFTVSLAEKKHLHVEDLLFSLSETKEQVDEVPEFLLADGNCIPCALWHLSDAQARERFETIFSQDCTENRYCNERKHRTYKQCSDMLKLLFTPCQGLPEPLEGKFILHLEH